MSDGTNNNNKNKTDHDGTSTQSDGQQPPQQLSQNARTTTTTSHDHPSSSSKTSNTGSNQAANALQRKKSKLDNAKIRQILQDEEQLQQHLQPLFHAMLLRGSPQPRDTQPPNMPQQHQEQQPAESAQATPRSKKIISQQQRQLTQQVTAPPDERAPPRVPIDDYIPHSHEAIRQTPLFAQLYRLIQFQRDQYLVGTEYATWQQTERTTRRVTDPSDTLPYDRTAWGHPHLARIAADFIPTDTVRNAVVPLVTPLPTTTLYPLLQNACKDAILGQQANLNAIVKDSVLTFLKNPENRRAIKKSTYGFIETKYNEGGEGD